MIACIVLFPSPLTSLSSLAPPPCRLSYQCLIGICFVLLSQSTGSRAVEFLEQRITKIFLRTCANALFLYREKCLEQRTKIDFQPLSAVSVKIVSVYQNGTDVFAEVAQRRGARLAASNRFFFQLSAGKAAVGSCEIPGIDMGYPMRLGWDIPWDPMGPYGITWDSSAACSVRCSPGPICFEMKEKASLYSHAHQERRPGRPLPRHCT